MFYKASAIVLLSIQRTSIINLNQRILLLLVINAGCNLNSDFQTELPASIHFKVCLYTCQDQYCFFYMGISMPVTDTGIICVDHVH